MAQLLKHYALILAVAGAALFFNLGAARLWDRDEPRNAGCTAEMLARGDWVVPYFNGSIRAHKPVLLYWCMMSAYAVFGQNEFAARFWSALFGLGTVLCTYHIGRRLFTGEVGLWAALALATSLMFDVAARAATPDSTLIFFSTAAILAYVLATFPAQEEDETLATDAAAAPPKPRPYHELLGPDELFPASLWSAGVLYALLGLAALAKGPVGVILPMAVIGLFLLILRLPAEEASPAAEVEAPK
jgi:4-amino-4-deoxy-L-arabinose transferase-like glycosyltransferase